MSKKLKDSIRSVIFDVDGVVVAAGLRASEEAVKKYGLKAELIQAFFKTKWHDCVKGHVCLKELLAQELPSWGFRGTVNDYIDFWFETESRLDEEILQLASAMRKQGIKCYLGSNQEKLRAEHLWEKCNLKKHFDGHFFSCHIGLSKPDPAFYLRIQDSLKAKADELILIDDVLGNVQEAQKVGWSGFLWPAERHILI